MWWANSIIDWITDPTKLSAIATIVIAVFTGTLFFATFGQLRQLRRSVRVSERALTELERPFIFWSHIQSPDLGFFLAPNTQWDALKKSPRFTLSVVNHGRTPAGIDNAGVWFQVSDGPPDPVAILKAATGTRIPPIPNAEMYSVEMIVGPSAVYDFPQSKCIEPFTHHHREAILSGKARLYTYGWCVYRDIFSNQHETVFCRYWSTRHREWVPEGGRAKNYAN